MTRFRTAAAVGASALLAVAVLAGCSSSSDTTEATASAAESSTEMLPPVIITDDQTSATCAVGNFLDIVIPEDKLAGTTVSTDQPELVELTQAKEEGGATFNPGGTCLAPGDATIVVTNPDGSTRDIALTITE